MPFEKDDIIIGAAELSIDGINVGYTTGGINVRHANDFLDVEADQRAGVVKKEITMQRMFVTTTLSEATLANLQKAMAEPAAQLFSGTSLSFGEANPTVTEHVLKVVGEGPKDKTTRTYTFRRCISVDEVDHVAGARDAASLIPVAFECLKDENFGNTFGTVVDT